MTERQIAVARLLLCLVASLIIAKICLDTPRQPTKEESQYYMFWISSKEMIVTLSILLVYGIAFLAAIERMPGKLRVIAAVSTGTDLVLISYLVARFGFFVPFYLWYIYYVVSAAIRYGWVYSILAISASIVSSTSITYLVPHFFNLSTAGTGIVAPAVLAFNGFLLVLAFLFGRISDKQLSYQSSLAVVNDFRTELASLATSREIITHLLERTQEILNLENAFFLPARRGADASEAPGLRSVGTDPVLLSLFREGAGIWNVEEILKEQRPLLTNNPRKDPSLANLPISRHALRNIVAAPMMVRSTPVGVVYAVNRKDKSLSRADLELLELIATQVAPVVENALLWERLREAAASEERLRIARDLHDNFLQTLAAIKIHLERCKILIAKDPNRALGGIDKIHQISTRGLAEVRSYLSELRLMGPEPSRFQQAIERCASDAAGRAGFETELHIDLPEDPMPSNVALAGFQIVRELLNNAASHSGASLVKVNVGIQDRNLVLDVIDDGSGFNVGKVRAEKTSEGHLGLVGVEERARQSNGTFELTSAPGKGTHAKAVLPL